MQHPDEGTIHSWLDNALSAEEAARVESHVAECAQCAAAVAEARGFIAASSRILTALDDVPRGVVPAVPATAARKRDFRVLWRAAAAVLVVAGGSFIVMRDGGEEIRSTRGISDTVTSALAIDAAATAEAGVPAQAPRPNVSVGAASERRATLQTADPGEVNASTQRALSVKAPPQATGVSGRVAGAGAARVDLAAPTIARTSKEMQLSANVVTEQSGIPSLKELTVEGTPTSRRIVYQVSPTDTVTLTEFGPIRLRGSTVTTGVVTAQDRQQKASIRAAAPTRTVPATAAPLPPAPPTDSQRATDTVVATEGAVMMQAAGAATQRDVAATAPRVNSIRWVEAGTGKTLVLSGKLPVERLQEIKRRIETERADSTKKTP